MKFGSHVSIKDGYIGAAKRAKQLGASAFQYFPKNPRSLSIKKFDKIDAEHCKKYCRDNRIDSVSHSPYPTNLTPHHEEDVEVVTHSLLNDLAISEACGSLGVVVHFGKAINKQDPLSSYRLMIEVLNSVLEQWQGDCKILLENNAGQPGSMGTTLEELVQVRKLTDFPQKIGFCFDTCHAFASGIWDGSNWDEVVSKGKQLDYFENLVVIHLNNSKYPSGSGKDRHANIFNHGYVEERQWTEFMKSPVIQNIPLILETPDDVNVTHDQELQLLYQKWG